MRFLIIILNINRKECRYESTESTNLETSDHANDENNYDSTLDEDYLDDHNNVTLRKNPKIVCDDDRQYQDQVKKLFYFYNIDTQSNVITFMILKYSKKRGFSTSEKTIINYVLAFPNQLHTCYCYY